MKKCNSDNSQQLTINSINRDPYIRIEELEKKLKALDESTEGCDAMQLKRIIELEKRVKELEKNISQLEKIIDHNIGCLNYKINQIQKI